MMMRRTFIAALAGAALAVVTGAGAFAKDASSWTKLTLELRNTTATPERKLTVHPDGSATLQMKSITGKSQTVHGHATSSELSAVNHAFAKAHVDSLPAFVPDNRMLMGNTTVELDSYVGSSKHAFSASIDYYGGVTARVKPLVDALVAIEGRLASQKTTGVTGALPK